jgi:hypothetical protein
MNDGRIIGSMKEYTWVIDECLADAWHVDNEEICGYF